MKILFTGGIILAAAVLLGWNYVFPPKEINVAGGLAEAVMPQKTLAERIAEAQEKSRHIKGLYMTADVANDQGSGGTGLRNEIIRLADITEINGVVIDLKEVCGPDYNEASIRKLLAQLKEKNIWAIARIAISKDASRFNVHPDWYLQRKNYVPVTRDECARKKHLQVKSPDGKSPEVYFWRDKRGGYWIDPVSEGAREYVLEFSKKMIDLGFDELQFDYFRFPSDGDVSKIKYPVWNGSPGRCMVMQSYFEFLSKNLRAYKPEIILSADLFGYAALGIDTGIGQCIETIGNNFDYVSFMVYPSHYYNGLYLKADPLHNFPAVNYTESQARANPGVVVERSLQHARDFFDGVFSRATTTATASVGAQPLVKQSNVCNRPWLEDFYHDADKEAKRPYGVQKVRLQIDAAERVDKCGWLLWNSSNIYTAGALKKE